MKTTLKPTLKPKLSLTGILVEDENEKGFTAFLAEFPEAVAEGETEDEAKKNLFEALVSYLEHKKEESGNQIPKGNFNFKSFDLELA
jgi:predicted RNase H-like HicB family nuclease